MATAKKAAPKKVAPKKAVSKQSSALSTVPSTAKSSNPNPIFNIDEINLLLQAVNHSNVNELKLEKGDFKITIRQGATTMNVASPSTITQALMPQASAPITVPLSPPAPIINDIATDNLITIKSPMIGTFYRSSGPSKPLFVNVGDEIKVGQVLCIVEAMKLFNEIESEISGKIVKVLIDDNSPVEYDQPLFLVQP
jgi:acetyl-CoA carboxylase biotin carboxyl carrier protein